VFRPGRLHDCERGFTVHQQHPERHGRFRERSAPDSCDVLTQLVAFLRRKRWGRDGHGEGRNVNRNVDRVYCDHLGVESHGVLGAPRDRSIRMLGPVDADHDLHLHDPFSDLRLPPPSRTRGRNGRAERPARTVRLTAMDERPVGISLRGAGGGASDEKEDAFDEDDYRDDAP
jgi:hypothetical protein